MIQSETQREQIRRAASETASSIRIAHERDPDGPPTNGSAQATAHAIALNAYYYARVFSEADYTTARAVAEATYHAAYSQLKDLPDVSP